MARLTGARPAHTRCRSHQNAAFSFAMRSRNLPDHSLYIIIILPTPVFVKSFFGFFRPVCSHLGEVAGHGAICCPACSHLGEAADYGAVYCLHRCERALAAADGAGIDRRDSAVLAFNARLALAVGVAVEKHRRAASGSV